MEREDQGIIVPDVPSNEDHARDPEAWDIVVVGAGVAGSALAHCQGLAGRRTLVLEKSLCQPDRIVGELLQPGGYLMLKKMGLEACTQEIDAQEVYGYALFKGASAFNILYPTEGYDNDVAGRSFHHGRFVQRLRHRAAAHGSVTMRQGVALNLLCTDGSEWQEDSHQPVGGVEYKGQDGRVRRAFAHLTVACDGMYSMLRKHLHECASSVRKSSTFVGLILKDVTLPFPNHGHVILGDPAPILVYPISSTEARVLVDIPDSEKMPSAATGEMRQYLLDRILPQLPAELKETFKAAAEGSQLRSMQNRRLAANPLHAPGALLLGDSFNMRHPLTGGGMTVALSDTKLLCDMLQPLPDFTDCISTAQHTSEFYLQRKPLSSTINTLANALYEVFRQRDSEAHEEMRQACFDYLALGGERSAGPVALLSGLNPEPNYLVKHFFSVAVFGMARLPLRRGLYGVWLAFMLLLRAVNIILPIINTEGIRAVFFPSTAPQPYLQRIQKTDSMQGFASKLPESSTSKLL